LFSAFSGELANLHVMSQLFILFYSPVAARRARTPDRINARSAYLPRDLLMYQRTDDQYLKNSNSLDVDCCGFARKKIFLPSCMKGL
jgi:hypothetical protein